MTTNTVLNVSPSPKSGGRLAAAVIVIAVLSSTTALLVSGSRDADTGSLPYSSFSVTLANECLKFFISTALAVYYGSKFTFSWKENALFSIPAAIYCLDNNVSMIILQYYDPATYLILNNTKIISTAAFFRFFLGRRVNADQWIALALLAVGIVLAEIQTCGAVGDLIQSKVGLALILVVSTICGFGDVYTEFIFKKTDDSLHVQNAQLYLYGVLFNGVAWLWTEVFAPNEVEEVSSFFEGWSGTTLLIVLCYASIGISVGALLKFGDNMMRLYANACTVLITSVVSCFYFDYRPDVTFVLGAIVVLLSMLSFYRAQSPAACAKSEQPTEPPAAYE
eukprot:TRINITY_DN11481_c0_g1_i1.p1 TRINITY_DN11481_c0_g1~~TRINITY_DN11481_c0_g1_i1.p1  ORF type:complete len:336 (+),score=58.98 TRINITY_DN11481_c0_g1_i1:449-1456(+)